MIAPSVMKLTALPALADNTHWTIDDGARAIDVDPGEPGPVGARTTWRLELPAILMRRNGGALGEVDDLARAAHTGGHIAYLDGPGSAAPALWRGDTLWRTWKNELR
jgi:hypothetical protein